MLQSVRQDAKRQRLRPADGLFARLSVRQDPCQLGNLGDLSAIDFIFGFDYVHTVKSITKPL
jgi:hypothetical protein